MPPHPPTPVYFFIAQYILQVYALSLQFITESAVYL